MGDALSVPFIVSWKRSSPFYVVKKNYFCFQESKVNIRWQDDVLLMEKRGKFPS